MGNSNSAPFNYEQQLLNDVSELHTVEIDEKTGEVIEVDTSVKPVLTSDNSYGYVKNGFNVRRRRGYEKSLISYPFPEENEGKGYRTLWEIFYRGVAKFPQNRCLGTRKFIMNEESKTIEYNTDKTPKRAEFVWQSFSDIDIEAKAIGAGLVSLGYEKNENVGIFAPNRAEWVSTELGLYVQTMRVVALYATLGEEAVEYIINHADIQCVFVSKENLGHLLKVAHKCPKLKHIIQFDYNPLFGNIHENVDAESVEKAKSINNIELIGLSDLKAKGNARPDIFPNPASKDDLAYIMYTSGTTGNPKGAMLQHRNIVATIASVPYLFTINSGDRHLSYLPLAHIFETVVQAAFWLQAASIGFFQNNIKRLSEDLVELKPTFLAGVPRVFGRIYQTVFSKVAANSCGKRFIFNKKYAEQCTRVRNGEPRDKWADTKVFTPIRKLLGLEECKVILTGAAPCPPYLMEFLRVIVGCEVLQGYGATETSASVAVSDGNDRNVGHIGSMVVCSEVKLMPIEDMNYSPADKPYPRGEIWARGDNMFVGYFKDEKSTEETLKEGGWVATGDVGRWNPNGTLSIIDRKKNMFKLSQGEYVAAEKIEQEYGKSPIVGQIFVYGNSFKSFLLAVVVPSAETLSNWCKEQGYWVGDKECKFGMEEFPEQFKATVNGPHHDAIKAYVKEQLKQQEKPLKTFEKVVDIVLEGEIDKLGMGFTEANTTLTPTFKLRRPQLLQRYLVPLKEAYGKNGEPVGKDEKWPGEA